jgi:hypothetical protein
MTITLTIIITTNKTDTVTRSHNIIGVIMIQAHPLLATKQGGTTINDKNTPHLRHRPTTPTAITTPTTSGTLFMTHFTPWA